MFNRIIVPVDGSDESWRAVAVGDRLASTCAADLEIVLVAGGGDDVERERHALRNRVAQAQVATPEPEVHVAEAAGRSVATILGERLEAVNGSILVMASSGRGRSAAMVGSVANDVLCSTFGPVVLVGPAVPAGADIFGGDMVVALDGSARSETVLGLAGAWSVGFGARLWLTTMLEPSGGAPDAFESNYVGRLARDLGLRTKHEVEFEVLHGTNAAHAVTDFAERIGAGLIIGTTHGRTGLARLTLGSTAAAIVRDATCPVLLVRPPQLSAPPRPAPHTEAATGPEALARQ
jgi:nucleotide-binding universal stress UspA family protein